MDNIVHYIDTKIPQQSLLSSVEVFFYVYVKKRSYYEFFNELI